MSEIVNYIRPELLVLVPVLYFIGVGLKKTESVKDNKIPLLLGAAGVLLSVAYVLAASVIDSWQSGLMAAFTAITQGVLCAGCSVYVNQIIKQQNKEE